MKTMALIGALLNRWVARGIGCGDDVEEIERTPSNRRALPPGDPSL
jgi:hypothetical protein